MVKVTSKFFGLIYILVDCTFKLLTGKSQLINVAIGISKLCYFSLISILCSYSKLSASNLSQSSVGVSFGNTFN